MLVILQRFFSTVNMQIFKIGILLFLLIAASCAAECVPSEQVRSQVLANARWQSQIAEQIDAQGDHISAISHYRIALALERSVKDNVGAVQTLMLIGKEYEYLGHYNNRINSYRLALTLTRITNDRHGEVSVLTSLADAYLMQNKYDTALSVLRKSLGLAQKIGDREGEAKALRGLADTANDQNQYDIAIIYALRGLAIAQSGHDLKNAGDLWATLGIAYFWMGHYQKSIQYFNYSLKIAQSLPDSQMAADALSYLGDSYNGLSDFSRASIFYQKSLALERKINDYDGIEAVLGNSGNVSLFLCQYPQAIKYYSIALKMDFAIHDDQKASIWLKQIGQAYRYLGKYQKAIDYYHQSETIARRHQNDEMLSMCLSNIGEANWLLKRYDQATVNFQSALQIAARIQNRETTQWALVNQGNVYLDQGRYGLAVDNFQQALAVARETGTKRAIGYCFYRLMVAEKALANPGLAIFYGKQSVNIWQSIRRGLTDLDLSVQKSFVIFREDSYRQLAGLLIDQGRLPEAQQVLGLLKTQEYSDFVRGETKNSTGASGQADLTPQENDAAEQYAKISSQVIALGERKQALLDKKQARAGAEFTPEDQNALDQANTDLSVANRHLRDFLAQISTAFRAPTAANLPLLERLQSMKNALGLQNTLRRLHMQGQDAVVLETVLTPDRYAVIVTTAQSQKVEQFPIASADLSRKLLLFRQALQDPDADPRAPAEELYRILVAPIEADLSQAGAKTLMWSLDGPLRYIPIAALYDGKQYMAEKYVNEVFTLGSQSGFGQEEQANWEGLGMGVSLPPANSGFDPLPAVPDELHGVIRDALHASGVVPGEVLLDSGFTRTAMDHALEEQKYNLVHIASHFAVKPGDSDRSYLLLGDGSRLSLTQLASAAQVFQGVDLLTLSACNTAMGRVGADGKEVDSLGTIAQEQGAATVVASLWPVSDASTMLLMCQFYQWRMAHPQDSKAEALRQAQLAVMRGTVTQPADSPQRGEQTRSADQGITLTPSLPPFTPVPNAPFAHPFYWATFVLFGDWR